MIFLVLYLTIGILVELFGSYMLAVAEKDGNIIERPFPIIISILLTTLFWPHVLYIWGSVLLKEKRGDK